jgi:hypothetical protein
MPGMMKIEMTDVIGRSFCWWWWSDGHRGWAKWSSDHNMGCDSCWLTVLIPVCKFPLVLPGTPTPMTWETPSRERGNCGLEITGNFAQQMASFTPFEGIFYMPQICDMGPTALLPLRRKACWRFFRPENSDSFRWVWTRKLGYQRPAWYPQTTEATAVIAQLDSDWLQARWSGDRILVGVRFFAHVQTGPRAHPASCTVGTGSFPWAKQPVCGADHPPLSSAKVKRV